MVSGANSLPQKQVMEWVSKRYYSFNSIIRALNNQSQGKEDNISLPKLEMDSQKFKRAVLVGGGPSAVEHSEAIDTFLIQNPDILVVHASSKNAMSFVKVPNEQIFCLVGNEGHRLEEVFGNREIKGKCVLPPYPRTMGTYIPKAVQKNAFELEKIDFTDKFLDSHTAIGLQVIKEINPDEVFLVGYDGYKNSLINQRSHELLEENNQLFNDFMDKYNINIVSLFETVYKLPENSIYSII